MNYLTTVTVEETEDGTPYLKGERSPEEYAAIKEALSHIPPSGEGFAGFGRAWSKWDLTYALSAAKTILERDDQDK